ncbi:eukaryotic translation initiation factor 5B-like [Macadamia integrifolia]|uniref:eukaryotic translation initiation factor 5B-like n=1 Tax=Macadamia integrifolia TaxID=60698 RepID=UPI001C4F0A77|nr:eukaryotic translation initiation factor 5B-like [Macadamia integrifolia]
MPQAEGIEHHAMAAAGSYVLESDDDVEVTGELPLQMVSKLNSFVNQKLVPSRDGVCVQASSFNFLKAFMEFLTRPEVNIPVFGIGLGPVTRSSVYQASVMGKKVFATILALNVKVAPEARAVAEEFGVKILTDDVMDNLVIQFKSYADDFKKEKEAVEEVIFPCVLRIIPNYVLNAKDPIILVVEVIEGIAKVGTPICIPSRDFMDVGEISAMKINEEVDEVEKGTKVMVKLWHTNLKEEPKKFGRHFTEGDELVSHITKRSLDYLESNYQDKLSVEDRKLVGKLKSLFGIQ